MSTRCPKPPKVLPALVDGEVLEVDEKVVRIYNAGGPYASQWSDFRFYGPVASMRFDHHPSPRRVHPDRAVSYAAVKWGLGGRPGVTSDPLRTAVLECAQDGYLDRSTNKPRLVVWSPARSLRLLALSDSDWLPRAGGNAALLSGARGVARHWSRKVYADYAGTDEVDGLLWASSVHPAGRSMVLFERARTALPASPTVDRPLDEPAFTDALGRIAQEFNLTLL